MSNELAVVAPTQHRYDDPTMIATIKQTVAKGATDAQLRMFVEICKSTGLDPFLREIWYVPEKGIIMAGRDGYLRVANENPNFDGMETRVERDQNNIPIKAVCTVHRKDRSHPIICEAYFSEYKKESPVWRQYPSAMISKVAEVLALKRSFSINGVVTEEEIGQDGSGSAVAAQEVGQRKIEAMREAKAQGRPIIDAGPMEPEPPQESLHEALIAGEEMPTRRAAKPYDKFRMYAELEKVKKRFTTLGRDEDYYRILKSYGAHKRTDLPEDDGGKRARSCYKELSLAVADLETAARLLIAKDTAPPVPAVERLPDAIEQVLGTRMACDGTMWIVADNGEAYIWQKET